MKVLVVEIKVLEANCTTSNKSLDGLLQTTPIEEFLDSVSTIGSSRSGSSGCLLVFGIISDLEIQRETERR